MEVPSEPFEGSRAGSSPRPGTSGGWRRCLIGVELARVRAVSFESQISMLPERVDVKATLSPRGEYCGTQLEARRSDQPFGFSRSSSLAEAIDVLIVLSATEDEPPRGWGEGQVRRIHPHRHLPPGAATWARRDRGESQGLPLTDKGALGEEDLIRPGQPMSGSRPRGSRSSSAPASPAPSGRGRDEAGRRRRCQCRPRVKASVRPSGERAGFQSAHHSSPKRPPLGVSRGTDVRRLRSQLSGDGKKRPGGSPAGSSETMSQLLSSVRARPACRTFKAWRCARDVGHAPFRAAEHRDQIDPRRALVRLAAEERDEAAVGGPGWALVHGRIPGQAQRVAQSDQLPVDVEVVLLLRCGTVRKRRSAASAGRTRR